MKVAALDLGSNTFLCLIAENDEKGNLRVIEDQTEVVRLGQGLAKSGAIATEALMRASKCLKKFSENIQHHKPDLILAVATAATRKAINGAELVAIAEQLKIPIQVISGIEEAELTFRGALSHLKKSSELKLVIDIGGASTEIICGSLEKGITFKQSFEVGVVKLKEKFVTGYPLSPQTLLQLSQEIEATFTTDLMQLKNNLSWDIIAVAGTPTTLAAAALGKFDPEKVEGFEFSLEDLEAWKMKLLPLTPEQVESTYAVVPGRSDVLCIGVLILLGVMKSLSAKKLKVSTRGLRFGVAQQLINTLKENSARS